MAVLDRMKRLKGEPPGGRRLKLSHFLIAVAALYLIFLTLKFPKILQVATMISGEESYHEDFDVKKSSVGSIYKDTLDRKLEDIENQEVSVIPYQGFLQGARTGSQTGKPTHDGYGRITSETLRLMNKTNDLSTLELMAEEAWNLGITAWDELQNYDITDSSLETILEGKPESCPSWVYMSGKELGGEHVMFLPCGLAAGSAITVVGTPRQAHQEYVPQLARFRNGDGTVYVSQFMVELQGLKVVEGEAPPKILHLNPRVRGDWNRQPVVEHNTCYRMQWGQAQRCNGSPSRKDDDMLIDGFKRCEKWMSNDVVDPKGSKTTSWFNRFIGRKQKPEVTWPFPFAEGKLFILTIRAGIEGYHITVGGRHISSFPYRTGFTLEDATGLAVGGDVDVHAVYATALPTSHPSFSPQRVLEMSPDWKSHPLPKKPIHLFIGILSASNHFAERMAVRKTWMQSPEVKSSHVAVRFFVALSRRQKL